MKLVLIVEDEYGNAEVLQLLLEAEGYRVTAASNGLQALDLLHEGEKPALIISDFMMPIMDGGEFGTALRQDATLRQIPFVFVSATSEDVVRRGFQDYDAFLAKPVEIDPLLALVKRLIEEGRPPRAGNDQAEESMRQVLQGMRVPPRH